MNNLLFSGFRIFKWWATSHLTPPPIHPLLATPPPPTLAPSFPVPTSASPSSIPERVFPKANENGNDLSSLSFTNIVQALLLKARVKRAWERSNALSMPVPCLQFDGKFIPRLLFHPVLAARHLPVRFDVTALISVLFTKKYTVAKSTDPRDYRLPFHS